VTPSSRGHEYSPDGKSGKAHAIRATPAMAAASVDVTKEGKTKET
jgi:hypothetical protein